MVFTWKTLEYTIMLCNFSSQLSEPSIMAVESPAYLGNHISKATVEHKHGAVHIMTPSAVKWGVWGTKLLGCCVESSSILVITNYSTNDVNQKHDKLLHFRESHCHQLWIPAHTGQKPGSSNPLNAASASQQLPNVLSKPRSKQSESSSFWNHFNFHPLWSDIHTTSKWPRH